MTEPIPVRVTEFQRITEPRRTVESARVVEYASPPPAAEPPRQVDGRRVLPVVVTDYAGHPPDVAARQVFEDWSARHPDAVVRVVHAWQGWEPDDVGELGP